MPSSRLKIIIGLAFLLIIIFFASRFFIDKNENTQIKSNTGSLSDTILDNYLTATKKTGEFTLTTTVATSPPVTETAKFWIDQNRFRIDFIAQSGTKRMTLVSEDGKDAYFCDPEHSICFHTGIPIEQYLAAFYLPSDNLEILPKENDQDCQQIKYVVQETFTASDNKPYYIEDIVYCISNESLLSFTSNDAFLEPDGQVSAYLTHEHVIKSFNLDPEIPPDTFKLLYPIGTDPLID